MRFVTQEILRRAKLKGACSEDLPGVGTPLGEIKASHLLWAEEVNLLTKSELADLVLPLWCYSRDGYGCGYGYGDGYGDGTGYGDG